MLPLFSWSTLLIAFWSVASHAGSETDPALDTYARATAAASCPFLISAKKNSARYLLRAHAAERGYQFEEVAVAEYRPFPGLKIRNFRRQVWPGLPLLPGGSPRRLDDRALREAQARALGIERYAEWVAPIRAISAEQYLDRFEWEDSVVSKIRASTLSHLDDLVVAEAWMESLGRRVGALLIALAPYGWEDGRRVPSGVSVERFYGGPFDRFRGEGEKLSPLDLPRPPSGLPFAELFGIDPLVPAAIEDPELWKKLSFGYDRVKPYGVDLELIGFLVDKTLPPILRAHVWQELISHPLQMILYDENPVRAQYTDRIFAQASGGNNSDKDRNAARRYRALGMTDLQNFIQRGNRVQRAAHEPPVHFEALGMLWRALETSGLEAFRAADAIDTSKRYHAMGFSEGFFADRSSLRQTWVGGPERLFESMETTGEEDAYVTMYTIVSLIRSASVHREMAGSLDPKRAEAARVALAYALRAVALLESNIERWATHPNPFLRRQVASGVNYLPEEVNLGRPFLFQKIHLPLLLDTHRQVAFDALYTFRFTHTAESLREALEMEDYKVTRDTRAARSWRALAELEMDRSLVEEGVKKFRGFIPYEPLEAHHHFPGEGFMDVRDYLTKIRGFGTAGLREIISLSLLEDVPFRERVLNTVPMDY